MNWLIVSIMLLQGVDFAVLEKKSAEAREVLKKESIAFGRAGKGKNSRIASRDILLSVGALSADGIKIVRLVVEVPKSARYRSFKFKVATSGYNVERISGAGITRLIFKVTDKDTKEELTVLDSRHLHLEQQRTSPRDLYYFPYSDLFQEEYFSKLGLENYRQIIKEARKELCSSGAKSKAYPEKLLCEVFPDQWLITLGAIEQMDDGEFFANSDYSINKFLAHVARNRDKAFYYSISVDGARGLMQFMNSRRYPTYNQTRKNCPEIGLISDFELATANMKNSIKAAACLADINLAGMPEGAKKKFLEDPFTGGEAVAAAHNGGLGRALNFLKGKRIPKETQNFIKKYKATWKILESR